MLSNQNEKSLTISFLVTKHLIFWPFQLSISIDRFRFGFSLIFSPFFFSLFFGYVGLFCTKPGLSHIIFG